MHLQVLGSGVFCSALDACNFLLYEDAVKEKKHYLYSQNLAAAVGQGSKMCIRFCEGYVMFASIFCFSVQIS